jgi:hypothetical protein
MAGERTRLVEFQEVGPDDQFYLHTADVRYRIENGNNCRCVSVGGTPAVFREFQATEPVRLIVRS